MTRETHTGLKKNVDTTISIVDTATRLFNISKDKWRENFTYSVSVSEKDSLYRDILKWVTDQMSPKKTRSVVVTTNRGNPGETSPNYEVPTYAFHIALNTAQSGSFFFEGHRVYFETSNPDITNKDQMQFMDYDKKLVFTVNSFTAQQKLLNKLSELNDIRSHSRNPVLRMVNGWGNWTTRVDLPLRNLDSVALPHAQKDMIVKDLRDFLASEETYNRLAIPWHRGYMFYGPPGTGKTSLVKALAEEFKLDLWYISLSDLKAESSLTTLLSEVNPRSLLLLEDIDTVRITHDRDIATPGQISMSSLLNALDGVATPHGLVTIMTTNRFEVLDPALTRAGRMDIIEHLDYPSVSTLREMFIHFYGRKPRWTGDHILDGLSTAQVAEIMKRNLHDSKNAEIEIKKLITQFS